MILIKLGSPGLLFTHVVEPDGSRRGPRYVLIRANTDRICTVAVDQFTGAPHAPQPCQTEMFDDLQLIRSLEIDWVTRVADAVPATAFLPKDAIVKFYRATVFRPGLPPVEALMRGPVANGCCNVTAIDGGASVDMNAVPLTTRLDFDWNSATPTVIATPALSCLPPF